MTNGLKKLLLAGGLVVACAAAGIAALGGSVVSSVPFKDVAKRRDTVQVYGKLDKHSIRTLRGYNLVAFDLIEEGTGDRISLVYENMASGLPANFPTASHARATGVYDPVQRKFVTDSVATKCPSKYKEDQLDQSTRIALEKWKNSGSPVPAKTEGS